MDLLNERTKGRDEGVILEQLDIITKKVKKGLELPEIAEAMEKEETEIRPVWEAVKKAAPTDSMMDILRVILDSERYPITCLIVKTALFASTDAVFPLQPGNGFAECKADEARREGLLQKYHSSCSG